MDWIGSIIGFVSPLISGSSPTELPTKPKINRDTEVIAAVVVFVVMIAALILILRKK